MLPLLNLFVKVILFMTFFHGFRSRYLTVSKQVVYICHHLQLKTSISTSPRLSLSTLSSFKLALISLYLKQTNFFISGAFSYLNPVGNKHETALGFLQAALFPRLCGISLTLPFQLFQSIP